MSPLRTSQWISSRIYVPSTISLMNLPVKVRAKTLGGSGFICSQDHREARDSPIGHLVLLLWSESRSVVSDSLWPHGLYSPWNSPGQNTGVGSLSLLQGIFQTQRWNPGLPHYRWILYQLSHKENPRILEWAAYPLSRGSSWPRNWTGVSYIAGGFFTNWAIREALKLIPWTVQSMEFSKPE